MDTMATIVAEQYCSFEESRCRPIHTYQIGLTVITLVEIGEEETMFSVKLTVYLVAMATILARYQVK